MTIVSLRDQILKADDIREEIVVVEEWNNAKIKVKTISGLERARMIKEYIDEETGGVDLERMYPSLLIATCHVPETDEKLFTAEDADALNAKSGKAIEKVASVAVKLNGLDQAAVERAGKGSSSKAAPTSSQKGASTSN